MARIISLKEKVARDFNDLAKGYGFELTALSKVGEIQEYSIAKIKGIKSFGGLFICYNAMSKQKKIVISFKPLESDAEPLANIAESLCSDDDFQFVRSVSWSVLALTFDLEQNLYEIAEKIFIKWLKFLSRKYDTNCLVKPRSLKEKLISFLTTKAATFDLELVVVHQYQGKQPLGNDLVLQITYAIHDKTLFFENGNLELLFEKENQYNEVFDKVEIKLSPYNEDRDYLIQAAAKEADIEKYNFLHYIYNMNGNEEFASFACIFDAWLSKIRAYLNGDT